MTPWTVAYQAPLSMEFSRQEYWGGLPFPSPASHLKFLVFTLWASLIAQLVKNLPATQETQDPGSVPGSGRFPGEGNGNPLQYSCLAHLDNPLILRSAD